MKSFLITVSSVALTGIINTTQANNFNYNYIEGGYSTYNEEGIDGAFDMGGSYDIANNINVIANYKKIDAASVDPSQMQIGLGYHIPIADGTDLAADLSYLKTKAKTNNISVKDTGYGIGIGVRRKFTDHIEGNARIEHLKFDNDDTSTLTVGGLYAVNHALSAGIDLTTEGDDGPEIIRSSLRWNML